MIVRATGLHHMTDKLWKNTGTVLISKHTCCRARASRIGTTIMTSSNGNIFLVTGPLFGEFSGGFPAQRPVARNFEVFIDLRLNKRLSKQSRRRWLRRTQYDVIVM